MARRQRGCPPPMRRTPILRPGHIGRPSPPSHPGLPSHLSRPGYLSHLSHLSRGNPGDSCGNPGNSGESWPGGPVNGWSTTCRALSFAAFPHGLSATSSPSTCCVWWSFFSACWSFRSGLSTCSRSGPLFCSVDWPWKRHDISAHQVAGRTNHSGICCRPGPCRSHFFCRRCTPPSCTSLSTAFSAPESFRSPGTSRSSTRRRWVCRVSAQPACTVRSRRPRGHIGSTP